MYDPFQAKFTRVMVVSGESQSVATANARGQASNLLIDIVAFLELFNVRLERRLNFYFFSMFQPPPPVLGGGLV